VRPSSDPADGDAPDSGNADKNNNPDWVEGFDDDDIALETCDATYVSLDAITGDLASIPDICIGVYMISTMQNDLNQALNDYQIALDSGYDKKFSDYAEYVSGLVPSQTNAYMKAHSNDHFTCRREKRDHCCSNCISPTDCSGCNGRADCVEGAKSWIDDACPGAAPVPVGINTNEDSYEFTCVDEEALFSDLADQYGVLRDWISLSADVLVSKSTIGDCSLTLNAPDDCFRYYFGYPYPLPDMKVPNPKDIVSSALIDLAQIRDALAIATYESKHFVLGIPIDDVIDGASLPVYMTVEAVASMQVVIEKANELEKEERKQLILGIIMAVLMIVPVLGEAAGALGLASLARIIVMVDAVSETAFTIYGIVDDPSSAVFLIFGALAARDFVKAAGARRAMSSSIVSKFPDGITNTLNKVDKLTSFCRR